jgi:hypothetical protein
MSNHEIDLQCFVPKSLLGAAPEMPRPPLGFVARWAAEATLALDLERPGRLGDLEDLTLRLTSWVRDHDRSSPHLRDVVRIRVGVFHDTATCTVCVSATLVAELANGFDLTITTYPCDETSADEAEST